MDLDLHRDKLLSVRDFIGKLAARTGESPLPFFESILFDSGVYCGHRYRIEEAIIDWRFDADSIIIRRSTSWITEQTVRTYEQNHFGIRNRAA